VNPSTEIGRLKEPPQVDEWEPPVDAPYFSEGRRSHKARINSNSATQIECHVIVLAASITQNTRDLEKRSAMMRSRIPQDEMSRMKTSAAVP